MCLACIAAAQKPSTMLPSHLVMPASTIVISSERAVQNGSRNQDADVWQVTQ
jgi:hypothetical protein